VPVRTALGSRAEPFSTRMNASAADDAHGPSIKLGACLRQLHLTFAPTEALCATETQREEDSSDYPARGRAATPFSAGARNCADKKLR
jgi:hypothetical protein